MVQNLLPPLQQLQMLPPRLLPLDQLQVLLLHPEKVLLALEVFCVLGELQLLEYGLELTGVVSFVFVHWLEQASSEENLHSHPQMREAVLELLLGIYSGVESLPFLIDFAWSLGSFAENQKLHLARNLHRRKLAWSTQKSEQAVTFSNPS